MGYNTHPKIQSRIVLLLSRLTALVIESKDYFKTSTKSGKYE